MTNLENEIIEEFELFDNWEDKYQYLIDLGKELKGVTLATILDTKININ